MEKICDSYFTFQSIMGQFAHPIFKTGDYSPVMKEYVAKKDKEASKFTISTLLFFLLKLYESKNFVLKVYLNERFNV